MSHLCKWERLAACCSLVPVHLWFVPAAVLDQAVMRVCPSLVLELGTHCGYSSVRLLRLLLPAGRLITVEVDPVTAELGEEILLVAGFKHSQVHKGKGIFNFNETVIFYILPCFSDSLQFQVLTSSSAEAIPTLRLHLGADKGSSEGFSLILMDHDPRQYLPDLLALEREELLSPSGCSIILINRRKTHDDISDVVAEIRSRSNLYSVLSEYQFMLEVFYCKKPTNVAL